MDGWRVIKSVILAFGAFFGFLDPFWGPRDATSFSKKKFYSAQLDMKTQLAAKFQKKVMDGYPAIVRIYIEYPKYQHRNICITFLSATSTILQNEKSPFGGSFLKLWRYIMGHVELVYIILYVSAVYCVNCIIFLRFFIFQRKTQFLLFLGFSAGS